MEANNHRAPPKPLPITIAYLILAHSAPDQLAHLVHSLPENSPILIHIDLRADAEIYERCVELLSDRPKLKFVKRHKCWWGSFGIVEGTISLIRTLVDDGTNFDYATLLSGSDYPIKSNSKIAEFLARNRGREFIESFLLTEPNRWSNHARNYRTPEKVLRRHFRFRSRVIRLPGSRKMLAGLQPYGGSQWWTLTSEAIAYVAQFVDASPGFRSFFKQSFIPDESFFQTIISNSYLVNRVTGDNLRLVVNDRCSPPYPAILKIDDLDMLLSSDKLFARKFDIQRDAAVLQALDERNNASGDSLGTS